MCQSLSAEYRLSFYVLCTEYSARGNELFDFELEKIQQLFAMVRQSSAFFNALSSSAAIKEIHHSVLLFGQLSLLFTSEVISRRNVCTCCTPCPSLRRSTSSNVALDVDKTLSSTAFYFRCRSPERIAIRPPFLSTRTSVSSMERRLRRSSRIRSRMNRSAQTLYVEIWRLIFTFVCDAIKSFAKKFCSEVWAERLITYLRN